MSEQGVPVETEDAGFESGFNDVPPITTVTNEAEPQSQPASEPKAEAKTGEKPADKAKPEAEEAPEYIQVTKKDWESVQAAIGKMSDYDKQFSKAFGTTGALQQAVKKLQEATPFGASIDLPADAFADMEADYPELANVLRTVLGKALKNVRGTRLEEKAAEPEATQQPSEADQKSVSALIREAMHESAREVLEDEYPDWRDIVGAVDAEGNHDPNHPFRKWLATQDETYQHRINSTNSPGVIARAIERFQKESTKPETKAEQKPAPQIAARRDRIASAVQPKGDGKPPTLPKSADDEEAAFEKGFASG